MGITARTLYFCSNSATDLPVIFRQSLKSAVSQHVFLWSTAKMFAELVTSGNMVQLKNRVCFILSEAKVVGGLRYKENVESF